jgi:hypothetical protein
VLWWWWGGSPGPGGGEGGRSGGELKRTGFAGVDEDLSITFAVLGEFSMKSISSGRPSGTMLTPTPVFRTSDLSLVTSFSIALSFVTSTPELQLFSPRIIFSNNNDRMNTN